MRREERLRADGRGGSLGGGRWICLGRFNRIGVIGMEFCCLWSWVDGRV